ncbi:MAG: hypothetical protein U0931_05055 [Vulcanimicrobiota bacterium]
MNIDAIHRAYLRLKKHTTFEPDEIDDLHSEGFTIERYANPEDGFPRLFLVNTELAPLRCEQALLLGLELISQALEMYRHELWPEKPIDDQHPQPSTAEAAPRNLASKGEIEEVFAEWDNALNDWRHIAAPAATAARLTRLLEIAVNLGAELVPLPGSRDAVMVGCECNVRHDGSVRIPETCPLHGPEMLRHCVILKRTTAIPSSRD